MSQLTQVQILCGVILFSLIVLTLAGVQRWFKYIQQGTPEQQTFKTLLHLGVCFGLILLFGKL